MRAVFQLSSLKLRPWLRQARILLVLLAVLLVGCGAPGSGTADSTVQGEMLPGRLLFVRQGVIWRWQGHQAAPLFGDGAAIQPAWSPTGDRIAYITRSNSFSDLLLADATGRPLDQLTSYGTTEPPNSLSRVYASRWVFYPAWSPDGLSIATAAQPAPPDGDPPADYNLGLDLLPVGPGITRTLYAADEAQVGRIAFSPDGATLVFTRATSGPAGGQRLYRMELAAGIAIPLDGVPEPSYDPAFSPDGAWLAFAARDSAGTDIFMLPTDSTSAPLRLSDLGMARAPAFAPDSSQIAFLAVAPGAVGFDLWVAELRRTETGAFAAAAPRRLTNNLGLDADSGLAWAP